MTAIERLNEKFEIDPETGCWPWTASLDQEGYGMIRYEGRVQRAHRVSYTLLVGPIPAGMELDHTCHGVECCRSGNACPHRRCIHPDHLEPVTHKENMARGAHALKTHCPQGHAYTPDNVYLNQNRRTCKTCTNGGSRARVAVSA